MIFATQWRSKCPIERLAKVELHTTPTKKRATNAARFFLLVIGIPLTPFERGNYTGAVGVICWLALPRENYWAD